MIPLSDHDHPGQRFAVVNTSFVLINVAVFVWQFLLNAQGLQGGTAGDPCLSLMSQAGALTEADRFICTYGVIPAEILQGQDLWTLLTAMFLHGGLLHIGSNMLYLWVFGDNIERAIGSPLYFVFYLIGGIVAFAVQTLMSGALPIPNIGASGAVAAVLGAYLVLFPTRPVRTLIFLGCFFWVISLSALFLLGFWFITQIISGVSTLERGRLVMGGIAYWAHIGGFLFGAAVGLVMRAVRFTERYSPY